MKLEALYFLMRQVLEQTPMHIQLSDSNSSLTELTRDIEGLPNKARTLMATMHEVMEKNLPQFTMAETNPLQTMHSFIRELSWFLDDLESYHGDDFKAWSSYMEMQIYLEVLESTYGPYYDLDKLQYVAGLCATTADWLDRSSFDLLGDPNQEIYGEMFSDARASLQVVVASVNSPTRIVSVCCEEKLLRLSSDLDRVTGAAHGVCSKCESECLCTLDRIDLNTAMTIFAEVYADVAFWVANAPERKKVIEELIQGTPGILDPLAIKGKELLNRGKELLEAISDDRNTVIRGVTLKNWIDSLAFVIHDIESGNLDPEMEVDYGTPLVHAHNVIEDERFRMDVSNYFDVWYSHRKGDLK